MQTYTLPEDLLQRVVTSLETLPARDVRALLNALEAECRRQDSERVEQERQALRAALLTEIRST